MKTNFKKRYDNFFGKNSFEKLLETKKKIQKNQYIRVNISKTFNREIENFFKKNRVKYSKTFLPNSFKIEKSFFNISSSLPALKSEIYIQDIASQIPINLIDFEKYKGLKINILDMAAAPGSKTTQICDLCEFYNVDYNLIALEPDKKRSQKLINNLQKQICKNVKNINTSGENFKSSEKFDIILLDAPCSGNLIDDNNWLNKRDLKGIEKMSNIQKNLLKNASKLLKENGTLIYSTCSLEIEENENNVLWAQNNLGLKSVDIRYKFGFEVKSSKILIDNKYNNLKSLRFYPPISKTQGFFVNIFEKN